MTVITTLITKYYCVLASDSRLSYDGKPRSQWSGRHNLVEKVDAVRILPNVHEARHQADRKLENEQQNRGSVDLIRELQGVVIVRKPDPFYQSVFNQREAEGDEQQRRQCPPR